MTNRPDVRDRTREIGWSTSRRTVASYESYGEAQAAVDGLADDGFPVERVAIVGSDLRVVEQVTGRVDPPRVALYGAVSGAFVGTLFGLLLGLFVVDDTEAWALLVFGLAFGLVVGALWALLGHWATGGRRDFSSVSGIVARHYDLVTDEEIAEEARRRLAASGSVAPTGPPPASA